MRSLLKLGRLGPHGTGGLGQRDSLGNWCGLHRHEATPPASGLAAVAPRGPAIGGGGAGKAGGGGLSGKVAARRGWKREGGFL